LKLTSGQRKNELRQTNIFLNFDQLCFKWVKT
jgi:hypothetical protein